MFSLHVAAQSYDSVPLRYEIQPACTVTDHATRYAAGVVFDACEADYILLRADRSCATGQAVVICPGGGYAAVVFDHEGLQVARWLNAHGVTAMILRYRMPRAAFPERPMDDARLAVRMVRDSAAAWGIDPRHVGIMGFSAGGHLAAMQSVAWGDDRRARPDFSLLFYPVISMDEGIVDEESRDNLLGLPSTHDVYDRYSCEKLVSPDTPPAFIAMSDDDDDVDSRNSSFYYMALKRAGVPSSLHAFSTGRHGWGWNPSYAYHEQVTRALADWLQWELHR